MLLNFLRDSTPLRNPRLGHLKDPLVFYAALILSRASHSGAGYRALGKLLMMATKYRVILAQTTVNYDLNPETSP